MAEPKKKKSPFWNMNIPAVQPPKHDELGVSRPSKGIPISEKLEGKLEEEIGKKKKK